MSKAQNRDHLADRLCAPKKRASASHKKPDHEVILKTSQPPSRRIHRRLSSTRFQLHNEERASLALSEPNSSYSNESAIQRSRFKRRARRPRHHTAPLISLNGTTVYTTRGNLRQLMRLQAALPLTRPSTQCTDPNKEKTRMTGADARNEPRVSSDARPHAAKPGEGAGEKVSRTNIPLA